MRKHVARALLVGGAAAAAVALGAGQASAATTVTIAGADTTFTATSANPVFDDLDSGTAFRCTGSTMTGSIGNVTSVPLPFATTQSGGTPHSVTGLTFSGCALSLGPITTSVPAADLPDDLVITATGTTAPQAGGFVRTAGTAGLLAHFSVATCSFDVAGQADAMWTNGTGNQLNLTGNGTLTPANASAGCLGFFNDGDELTYTASYTVTPNTINVTP